MEPKLWEEPSPGRPPGPPPSIAPTHLLREAVRAAGASQKSPFIFSACSALTCPCRVKVADEGGTDREASEGLPAEDAQLPWLVSVFPDSLLTHRFCNILLPALK